MNGGISLVCWQQPSFTPGVGLLTPDFAANLGFFGSRFLLHFNYHSVCVCVFCFITLQLSMYGVCVCTRVVLAGTCVFVCVLAGMCVYIYIGRHVCVCACVLAGM